MRHSNLANIYIYVESIQGTKTYFFLVHPCQESLILSEGFSFRLLTIW